MYKFFWHCYIGRDFQFCSIASGKTSSGIVAWSGSAQLLLIRLVCVDNGINRSSIGCKIIWPLLCLFLMKASWYLTVFVTEARRLNLLLLRVIFATDTFGIAEGTPAGLGLLQLRKQPWLASAACVILHTVNGQSAQ